MAKGKDELTDDRIVVIRHNETGEVLLEESVHQKDFTKKMLAGAAMYAIEIKDYKPTGNPVVDATFTRFRLFDKNFSGSDLSGAVFSEMLLNSQNFSEVNLAGAVFIRTHLLNVNLRGADLTQARLGSTVFQACETLGDAIGLNAVDHRWESSVDSMTLQTCIAKLPDAFLQGVGYTNTQIRHLRSLYAATRQSSCFLSYARQDAAFANRLRDHLLRADVTCWQDVHDIQGGDFWRGQIYEAISRHERVVLICSRASLERPSVVEEILETIALEKKTGTQKLFPIRIDDFILSEELEAIGRTKVLSGEWRENWINRVRAYHIVDFSDWRLPARFQEEFNRLLKSLNQPPRRIGTVA